MCILQGADSPNFFDREEAKIQVAIRATQDFKDLTIEAFNDARDAYAKCIYNKEISTCDKTLEYLYEKLRELGLQR